MRLLTLAAGIFLAAIPAAEVVAAQADAVPPAVHHPGQAQGKHHHTGQVPYSNQGGGAGLGAKAPAGAAKVPGEVAVAPHAHGHVGATQPYADLSSRSIKALSKEEIDGLLAGTGMGMALAAELNGYPGPRHVLELAAKLGLTELQRERTEHAFKEMEAKARPLGEAVIMAERELDNLFASGTATHDLVFAGTAKVSKLQGELRATHLSYHLRMVEILTSKQIEEYNRLRGYGTK